MDRVEIKEEAKKIIKTNKWNVWKPILVIAFLSFIISLVTSIMAAITDLDAKLTTSITESVIGFVLLPTTVGLCAYFLKLVRGQKFELNDLKAYYPFFFKIFVLDLLVSIFIALWSILLIIPGIIAAISYEMVYFICVDKEELTAIETIKESKEMMKGYKMDYFIFELSFIGWIILTPFTLGLLLIWLVPYMTIAQALFYEKLKEKSKK